MSKVNFNNMAKCRIEEAISLSATRIKIPIGSYAAWLSNHAAGGFFYAILRDAVGLEIVKVYISGSSTSLGLLVERGQEGTIAKSWVRQSLFYQDLTAAGLGNMLQKGNHRTIAYNPNDVLAPAYAYEKVYQSDLQLWWKAMDGVNTDWSLIVGQILVATPTGDYVAGTYPEGISVTLTCLTSGATIRYTIDGSEPTESSTLYSSPVTLPAGSVTLKAKGFHSDAWMTESEILSVSYTIIELNGWELLSGTFGGTTRYAASSIGCRNKLFFGAGYDVGGSSYLQDFFEYDPSAGTFTAKDDFCGGAGERAYAVMANPNDGQGKVFAGLGFKALAPDFARSDFYEYDIAAETWTAKTNYPVGNMRSGVAVGVGGKVYTGLGEKGSMNNPAVITSYNDWYEYDPAGDSWTQKTDFPGEGLAYAVATECDGKIYLGMGMRRYYDALEDRWYSEYTNEWYEYNPATDTWTEKTDFPGHPRIAGAIAGCENYVYVGTGSTYLLGLQSDWYSYSPGSDAWMALDNYAHEVRNTICGMVNGNVLTGLGYETLDGVPSSNYFTDIYKYVVYPTVSMVDFSVAGGSYLAVQSVELSCQDDEDAIYYTTDGSEPDNTDTLYESAISVDASMTLKARAYKSGWAASEVSTEVYYVITLGAWEYHSDDSDWSAVAGATYGRGWTIDPGGGSIQELGTWVNGYRPTKMRVEIASGTFDSITLKDSNGDTIASGNNVAHQDELTITFGSYDIQTIEFGTAAGNSTGGISFWVE